MIERKLITDPFESDVVADPERPLPVDVSVIHEEAFDDCRTAYERVVEHGRSWSVLLFGEAGCGKTHLLSRFRNWLNGGIEPPPRMAPALFVAVRMESGPGQVWRHLRRRLAEELSRRSSDVTALDRILRQFANRAGGSLDEAFDQTPVTDLGLDLVRVLEHFAAGRERRLCRAWLAGDALTEPDYQALHIAPPSGEDIDEDLAEFDARRVVLALTRLCAPAPVVFCFDQIEAMGIALQNKNYGAFSRMGASLVDTTENSLVVSTVLSTFLQDLEHGSMASDFQRIRKEQRDLQPLDLDQCRQLIAARLALVPELAGQNPVTEADLISFLASQHGRCTPRRLIHEARRLFRRWQEKPELPRETLEEFLSRRFEDFWTASIADSNPSHTDAVLGHGLPILMELSGTSIQDRPARHMNLGIEAGGTKLLVAYGNHGNMTSFARWLRPFAEEAPNPSLRILRDARLPVSPGAKAARERLEKIQQGGGRVLRVDAEALAALDAMRHLLGQATSGDLNQDGETIAPQTVREWLKENLPRGLARFTEDLLGKRAPGPDQPPDTLLELLRGRKVIALQEAAHLTRLPQEQIENYAHTHPDLISLFGGTRPVVCYPVAAAAQGAANGIR